MSQPPTPSKDADRIANEQCLSSRVSEGTTLVTGIQEGCASIIVHRRRSQQLATDAVTLFSVLKDNIGFVNATEFREMLDEIINILTSVYTCVRELSQYGFLQAFWRSGQIGSSLEQCDKEIGNALDKWAMVVAISLNNTRSPLVRIVRQDADEWQKYILEHKAELFKFTKRFLRTRQLMQEAAELHKRGYPAAERMMESSQLLLQLPLQCADSRGAADEKWVQEEYEACRERLVAFQRLTRVPPSIKILNGQVEKLGDEPFQWGSYSRVWRGSWLGRIKVALKVHGIEALPQAEARLKRAIIVWATLKHPNVLPFYGMVTDLGPIIHIVSPLCESGNLLQYAKANPVADRTHLLLSAARGLQYLHRGGVVHGNVRCTNILITDKGDACICDYGMLRIVAELTKTSLSALHGMAELTRWLAPEEVLAGGLASPGTSGDVWSFGMAALECFTLQAPYAEFQDDYLVASALERGQSPIRPRDVSLLTDRHWEILTSCWRRRPEDRATMNDIVIRMQQCI